MPQENQDFNRVAVGQVETAPAQDTQATTPLDSHTTQRPNDSSAPPLTQPADTAEQERQTPEGGAVESTPAGQAEASGQASPSDTGTAQEATPADPTPESSDTGAPTPDSQAGSPTTPSQAQQAQAGDQTNQTEGQTPSQTQTPPTLPPIPPLNTPERFPSNENLESFQAELAEAIARNEGVIQNTHYTLQGIAELLTLSADTYNFYKTSAAGVESNLESVRELQRALDSSRSYFQDVLNEVSQTHNGALELHERTTQELASKKAELLQASETLQAGLQALITQASHDLERAQEAQATRISEAGANEVRAIEAASSELAEELQEHTTALKRLLETSKSELQSELAQNLQAEINAKRAEIEREITSRLPALQAAINAKKTEIEATIRRTREEIEAEMSNTRAEMESYLRDMSQTLIASITQGATKKMEEAVTAIQTAANQALLEIRNAEAGGGAVIGGASPTPPSENAGQEGNASGGGQNTGESGETPPEANDNTESTPTEPPAQEQAPATPQAPQEDLLPGGFKAQRAHMTSEGDFVVSSQVSNSGAPLLERVRDVENLYADLIYDVAKMDNAKWNEVLSTFFVPQGVADPARFVKILEEQEGYNRYNPSQAGLEHKYPFKAFKYLYPEKLKTTDFYLYSELFGTSEDVVNAQAKWRNERMHEPKILQAINEVRACRSYQAIEALMQSHKNLARNVIPMRLPGYSYLEFDTYLWDYMRYTDIIQQYRDRGRLNADPSTYLSQLQEEIIDETIICEYGRRQEYTGVFTREDSVPPLMTLQENQTLLPPEQYKFLYPDLYPREYFAHGNSGRLPENDEELNQYLYNRLGSSSSIVPVYMKEYLPDGSPIIPYDASGGGYGGEDGGGRGA